MTAISSSNIRRNGLSRRIISAANYLCSISLGLLALISIFGSVKDVLIISEGEAGFADFLSIYIINLIAIVFSSFIIFFGTYNKSINKSDLGLRFVVFGFFILFASSLYETQLRFQSDIPGYEYLESGAWAVFFAVCAVGNLIFRR